MSAKWSMTLPMIGPMPRHHRPHCLRSKPPFLTFGVEPRASFRSARSIANQQQHARRRGRPRPRQDRRVAPNASGKPLCRDKPLWDTWRRRPEKTTTTNTFRVGRFVREWSRLANGHTAVAHILFTLSLSHLGAKQQKKQAAAAATTLNDSWEEVEASRAKRKVSAATASQYRRENGRRSSAGRRRKKEPEHIDLVGDDSDEEEEDDMMVDAKVRVVVSWSWMADHKVSPTRRFLYL